MKNYFFLLMLLFSFALVSCTQKNVSGNNEPSSPRKTKANYTWTEADLFAYETKRIQSFLRGTELTHLGGSPIATSDYGRMLVLLCHWQLDEMDSYWRELDEHDVPLSRAHPEVEYSSGSNEYCPVEIVSKFRLSEGHLGSTVVDFSKSFRIIKQENGSHNVLLDMIDITEAQITGRAEYNGFANDIDTNRLDHAAKYEVSISYKNASGKKYSAKMESQFLIVSSLDLQVSHKYDFSSKIQLNLTDGSSLIRSDVKVSRGETKYEKLKINNKLIPNEKIEILEIKPIRYMFWGLEGYGVEIEPYELRKLGAR